MKILMLIDSFTVSGTQRQFTTIAKELHKEYDVTVVVYHDISSHFEEELVEEGIHIEKILKKSKFDFKFIFRLLQFIRKEKFDASISFLDTPNFYNVLARITRSVPKVIVSQRSAYFKDSLSLKKRLQESFLYFADHITTNSITQKERMIDIFPFMEKKIHYLPNAYQSIEKPDLNKSLETNNFIVLSNLNEYKNALKLVQSIEILVHELNTSDFRIRWYGRFPITEKAKVDFEKAKAIIEDNELEKYIEFMGVTRDVNSVIKKSSALIHISDFEGCPNSVCEAMALSKPVILSNICDHPYLVSYDNGILINQKDPKDIAKGIFDFINLSNENRTLMGIKSKKYISNNLNILNSIKTLKNCF